MPRIRSRANTEEKFLQATLGLIAQGKYSVLGINVIAHQAGADKVLIYRYFGNLNGLLKRVAESRQWLPLLDDILRALPLEPGSSATATMHDLVDRIVRHIRNDEAIINILRWRKAETNPLTEHFSSEWDTFWQMLANHLSNDLDYEAREVWKQITMLTALYVEAEICHESVNTGCIDLITKGSVIGRVPGLQETAKPSPDDPLPTNLL